MFAEYVKAIGDFSTSKRLLTNCFYYIVKLLHKILLKQYFQESNIDHKMIHQTTLCDKRAMPVHMLGNILASHGPFFHFQVFPANLFVSCSTPLAKQQHVGLLGPSKENIS